jgi:hypothetical protein
MSLGSHRALLAAAGAAGGADDWVLLDEVTITGSAAQFEFTSAGSDDTWDNYRSLMCVGSLRNSNGGDIVWRFGSYSGGYTWTRADSTGSSIYTGSYSGWEARSDGIGTSSSPFFAGFRLLLVDHNDHTLPVGWNMQGSYNDSSSAGRMNRNMGTWKPSTRVAITQINLISGNNNPANQNFEVGSNAQVFGLKEPA